MKLKFIAPLLLAILASVKTSDDVNSLQIVVDQLGQQMTSLQARASQQDNKMAEMQTSLDQKSATITSQQTSLHDVTTQLALLTPFTAFDAQYHDDPHNDVVNHDIMKFDSVITNYHNAYNPHTGMFEAPVSGVYMFHVKVTPNPSGHIYVYLVKEGTNIDSANAYDNSANETGDTIRIIHVSKGERVWLMKNDGVTSVRGWAHTKLAGYLIRAT